MQQGRGDNLVRGPQARWAQSLRRETALQDQFRRAIHTEAAVANVGLERWNAASRLQEQMDASRGVEHTKRLAKSRAINARFGRRSVMKDLHGADLPGNIARVNGTKANSCSPSHGKSSGHDLHDDDEFELTREQALEKFGINLDRVGKMTTALAEARCASAVTADEDTTNSKLNLMLGKAGRGDTHGSRTIESLQTTKRLRRSGSFGVESKDSGVGVKGRDVVLTKLKVLDALLSGSTTTLPSLSTIDADQGSGLSKPLRESADENVVECPVAVCSANNSKEQSPEITLLGSSKVVTQATLKEGFAKIVLGTSKLADGEQQVLPTCTATSEEADDSPRGRRKLLKHKGNKETEKEPEHHGGCDLMVNGVLTLGCTELDTPSERVGDAEKKKDDQTNRAEVDDGKGLPEDRLDKPQLAERPLPTHSPSWWWISLLPPRLDGVSIPDTVIVKPTSCKSSALGTSTLDNAGGHGAPSFSKATPTSPQCLNQNGSTSTKQSGNHPHALLWVFSGSPPRRSCRNNSTGTANPHKGVLDDGEELLDTGTQRRVGSNQSARLNSLNEGAQELQKEEISGEQGLLRAARGICEYGRAEGGGEDGDNGKGKRDGGAKGGGVRLPLALLKIWERENESGRGHPAVDHTRAGSRRRLRVVALWTETDVIEALRDMSGGRWRRERSCRYNVASKVQSTTVREVSATSTTTSTNGPQIAHTAPGFKSASTAGTARGITSPLLRQIAVARGGQQPTNDTRSDKKFVRDEPFSCCCCVQAFVKGGGVASVLENTTPAERCTTTRDIVPASVSPSALPSAGGSPAVTIKNVGCRSIVFPLQSGVRGNKSRSDIEGGPLGGGSASGSPKHRLRRKGVAVCEYLDGPVFYRAAWRRTTGRRVCVWKITSRYPYVLDLAAHLCPLASAGSSPLFVATTAEEEAVVTATAAIAYLAKILRGIYDPSLQRLWADWVVSQMDGRWLLVEIHGVKTEADLRKALTAKALAAPEVKRKVFNGPCPIPPSLSCGQPGVEGDRARTVSTAARAMQDISHEVSKRMGTASKRPPNRPTTPSKVAEKSKMAAANRGVDKSDSSGGVGGYRVVHQYWRCAGDFCETRKGNRQVSEGNRGTIRTAPSLGSGDVVAATASSADDDDEDIVGRRKHALAVELPRTVLYRLVLNARAALLDWRASAADFALMEKPVQLCSTCYSVCNALEVERIETTRRVMEAEAAETQAGKQRRNRKPPGWKSRVQHELEDSLGADRQVVVRLMEKLKSGDGGGGGGCRAGASVVLSQTVAATNISAIVRTAEQEVPYADDKNRNGVGGSGGGHGGCGSGSGNTPVSKEGKPSVVDEDAAAMNTVGGVTMAMKTQTTLKYGRRTTSRPSPRTSSKGKRAPKLAPAGTTTSMTPTINTYTTSRSKTGGDALALPQSEFPIEALSVASSPSQNNKRDIRARRKAKERERRRLKIEAAAAAVETAAAGFVGAATEKHVGITSGVGRALDAEGEWGQSPFEEWDREQTGVASETSLSEYGNEHFEPDDGSA